MKREIAHRWRISHLHEWLRWLVIPGCVADVREFTLGVEFVAHDNQNGCNQDYRCNSYDDNHHAITPFFRPNAPVRSMLFITLTHSLVNECGLVL